jgi:L-2,4-diaminobutyrate decarboxylase
MANTDGNQIYSGASPEQVQADLEPLIDFQDDGLSLEELRSMIESHLAPHLMRYDLPTFQSMFNSFPEVGAEYGARVALSWNQGVTNWQVSPGGAVLEELSIRALCSLFGLSTGSDGTAMYCGSYANQQALYMALHKMAEDRGFNLAEAGIRGFEDSARLAVITSQDAHFSLRHAVRLLGLGERSLVTVEVDTNRRMDIERLRETLAELEGSRDVFCVVATAGTTATGAVDPIPPVADICEQLGSWLHVDGAYGLAYRLVAERQHLFAGVERADSVSWDPHKQFGVPIPSSFLFVRKQEDFGRMALFSSYFNRPDSPQPNPGIRSVPSTRPLSVLPLVTSIRHQGLKGVVERLRTPLVSIGEVASYLVRQRDLELCHQPDTGILCFRIVPAGLSEEELNRLQHNIYNRIMQQGERTISLTQLDGRSVLRLVAVSPSVTTAAMMDTIEEVRRVAETELMT